jgi:LysM repeat protein
MPVKKIMLMICLLISGTAMASKLDSVGVEGLEGKQIILHKLDPKESYFSLGRKYNVNPAAIIDFNRNKALKIGDLVNIPTQRPFTGTESKPALESAPLAEEFISYTVKPKETLYSIAKKFNTNIEEIKRINNLRISSLSIGQILKIKNLTTPQTNNEASATAVTTNNQPLMASVDSANQTNNAAEPIEERKLPATRYGLKEVREKGLASWIQDESLDETKMLALHPTAPIGTIIKLTNPMTQKSTFAKVVGKFTENESNKGLIIIITKTAADLIGALDKRFQVNLVYGIADEQ